MATYRDRLPQLDGRVFLTDSGLETDLVFNQDFELPEFAAFPLLDAEQGRAALNRYFREHIAVASESGVGIVLEAPTWRASADWGQRLGYDAAELRRLNQAGVRFLDAARGAAGEAAGPVVVSGAIGPQGDGYRPSRILTAEEAEAYHRPQLDAFADSPADMAHAMTMTYVAEAVGIVRAAGEAGMPIAISFTVETDGALPDGTVLRDAVRAVDRETDAAPVYYGINCAHPTHFADQLEPGAEWTARVNSIRANASAKSHAELDEATELDAGDPAALGAAYADLVAKHPRLRVLGGCCGTDVRHVQAIADACV